MQMCYQIELVNMALIFQASDPLYLSDANTLVALSRSLPVNISNDHKRHSRLAKKILLVQILDANHPSECIPASLRPRLETQTRWQQHHYVATSRGFSEQSGWLEFS